MTLSRHFQSITAALLVAAMFAIVCHSSISGHDRNDQTPVAQSEVEAGNGGEKHFHSETLLPATFSFVVDQTASDSADVPDLREPEEGGLYQLPSRGPPALLL